MRKMDTRQRARAEIVGAVRAFVLRAVPCAVAAYVLWLLVLVLVLCGPAAACAAEHLVEEAELGARLHDVGE